MLECWKCGAPIGEGEPLCAVCGAAAPGSTESFEPVGDAGESLAEAAIAAEGPVLLVRKGPQPGERFFLDRPLLTVGRDPDSDIFLNDMTVSREHAVLSVEGGIVRVQDAGSLNGTYVNGVCADRATLHEGDILQVGTFQMVYHAGGERL